MRTRESVGQRQIELSGVSLWQQRFLVVVVVVFSIGSLANVGIEAGFEPSARALLVRTSGELSTLTGSEFDITRERFWVASAVHDVAGGGVLVVPDGLAAVGSTIRNLAGIDVRIEDYDPAATPEMVDSLGGLPTIRGVGNITDDDDFLPFAVVWSQEGTPVPVLRLWFFEGSMFLIDDRVVREVVDQ